MLALGAGGAFAQQAPAAAQRAPSAPQQNAATPAQGQAGQPTAQIDQQGQRQVARQCLDDLRAFNDQMNEDGFWLSGWGGAGMQADLRGARTGAAADGYATSAPRAPASGNVPANQSPAARAPNTQDNAVTQARPPWGGSSWGIASPPYQIRTLYAAANVLGQRGDQQTCNDVLAEMKGVYGDYTGRLRQAGIEPGEVTSWRQQNLVGARPVTEIDAGLINLADVTGTEVRNPQDEQLGTVEDVVLDSEKGGIRYVVISSGGVLGIGEDLVALPWQALRTTPGMNTFVLNVSEEVIEDAPSIDPAQLADPDRSREVRREVDQFWHDQMSG
ncbi:PRC-barrel domain-containing protein [Ancylobacter sp. FA202]|uniref:PRC-barrel domain-containing protein n=1 Tax=Ancylobacter sp. FA202 TaxID=1111106 RepID=UPI00039F9F82|nr:PRC-barrel domain-containing protein [Ancylobacter sp. FA202]